MSVIDKVLEVAKSYVGYLEKASNSQLDSFYDNAGYNNYTKFNRDYCNFYGEPINTYQGAAWCAMFVTTCFAYAYGSSVGEKMIYGHYAYCPYGVEHFKNNGQWKTSPQAGDVIFFRSSNSSEACHTGIVYYVDSEKVYTIEGNTSSSSGVVANGGCVAKKSYPLYYSRIKGYGRPNWSLVGETKSQNEINLDKLVNAGYITDRNTWCDFTSFVGKGEAACIVDRMTGGTWTSDEASDNPWYSKFVYSLCGKTGGDPDGIKIITDSASWLANPNDRVSKAQFMALVDKSTGGTTARYKNRTSDHWGRNCLDSLCDKGYITDSTINAWDNDFEGTVYRKDAMQLLCNAFKL